MEKTEIEHVHSTIRLKKSSKGIGIDVRVSDGCDENEFKRVRDIAEKNFNELLIKYRGIGE